MICGVLVERQQLTLDVPLELIARRHAELARDFGGELKAALRPQRVGPERQLLSPLTKFEKSQLGMCIRPKEGIPIQLTDGCPCALSSAS